MDIYPIDYHHQDMRYNRHSIRLKEYDYSQDGYYFVTTCTQDRKCLFGEIKNGKMTLNEFGTIVDNKIHELKTYKNVDVDIYCVMPNHIHMIIRIVGAGPCACPNTGLTRGSWMGSIREWSTGSTQGSTPTVGECVKRLKTLTTRIYIDGINHDDWSPFNKRIWQRNFYEHIIRNERELYMIRQYIIDNPKNWEKDRNNEKNVKITQSTRQLG